MKRAIGVALAAVAVATAAVIDLATVLRPGLEPVPSEAIAAARAVIDARREPGTVVMHSPLFGVEELKALGDLPARPDLPDQATRSRRRVIVLDHEAAPVRGLGRASERLEVSGGSGLSAPVFVAVHEPGAGDGGRLVLFDLRDGLGPETLLIERPPGRVSARCRAPRAEGGFRCPGEPEWLYAATRRIRISGVDAECTWAHPTTGGVVVLEIPAVPEPSPGHELVLELAAGLSDDAVRTTQNGAAVTTRVRQSGRVIGEVVRTNALGFARARLPVEPGAPLRLEVTTPHDGARHHCLEAVIAEVPVGEGGS